MKKIPLLLLPLFAACSMFESSDCATAKDVAVVPYKVENTMKSPNLCDVKVEGYVKTKMDTFVYNRILSDEAKNVIYKEAEDAFKNKVDDITGVVGLWQGEFWGKLIISAVRVCEYNQDKDLKEFIRKSVDSLLTYQEADGYLGTYRNPLFLKVTDLEASKKVMKYECNWCWNLWCRKYTLWGLLEAYRLLGDKKILTAASRSMDQYIDMLHKNNIRICDTGTFEGMPSMSILKPLLVLYRDTGNQKYLDFAKEIVSYWNRDGNPAPNFLQNGFTDKPIYEWYPKPEKWAKVYEMISCLDGLLEYYRVTGDKKSLDCVALVEKKITADELNIMGGVGFNDMFAHAAVENNGITEPCDTIHYMRLVYELYTLTGKPEYMDTFENAFYNAFMAGIYRDGKWGARGIRTHSRHYTAEEQAKFVHNHCCVDNMPRGFMNMAQSFASVKNGELYVNLYSDASVKIEGFDVKIDGSKYFNEGKVVVKVKSKNPSKVYFRIPAWSSKSSVNGKDAKAGYFAADINGSGEYTLNFDMTAKVVESKNPSTKFDASSNQYRRWKAYALQDKSARELFRLEPAATIRVGPLLLARSKVIGNTEAEMFKLNSILGKHAKCRLTPIKSDKVQFAWEAEITSDAGTFKTKVCDYSSAGDEKFKENEKVFSVFF